MEIKDVRTWLESQPQFEIMSQNESGDILMVKRLKDSEVFLIGRYGNENIVFESFSDDCIHVILINEVKERQGDKEAVWYREHVKCEIDSIELSEDKTEIIAWDGEMVGQEGARLGRYTTDKSTIKDGGTRLFYSD